MTTTNDKLEDWQDIATEFAGASLLLGNGASRAVWEGFAYKSLLKATEGNYYKHKMKAEDYKLFETLDTENFEQVLGTLQAAIVSCGALGVDATPFEKPYKRIRGALGDAVQRAHIPWKGFGKDRRRLLAETLADYNHVFTTNYDLLVYWAVMEDKDSFSDYFWGPRFNLADCTAPKDRTKVLYLHGALHLYRTPTGEVRKATKGEYGPNLLFQFPDAYGSEAEPLLISEATSADKLRSIYGSEYLSFAYSKFKAHQGPLVIFGQGLSDNDQHIVDAIQSWPSQNIAMSMRGGTGTDVRKRKAEVARQLPDADIVYFKSSTHPLGDSKLHVERE